MEEFIIEEYIVTWLLDGQVDGDWARFDNYEDAKLLYDEMLRDDSLITASFAKSLDSTEL